MVLEYLSICLIRQLPTALRSVSLMTADVCARPGRAASRIAEALEERRERYNKPHNQKTKLQRLQLPQAATDPVPLKQQQKEDQQQQLLLKEEQLMATKMLRLGPSPIR